MSSQNEYPRITIVSANFNQGNFIENCIESVIKQNYPNLQYIIIDGGSSDKSVDIIQKYQNEIDYWISKKDEGQSDAINKGLIQANGEIFNWLNADDYLEPGALFKVADAYKKKPEAAGWVGACRRVDIKGKSINIVYPNNLERENIGQNWNGRQFYQPACFLNRNKVNVINGLNTKLYCAFDLDLWLRLLEIGEFSFGNGIWANAIIHEAAKTQHARDKMFEETINVQKKYGFFAGAENRYQRHFGNGPLRVILPKHSEFGLAETQEPFLTENAGINKKPHVTFISNFMPRFDKTSAHNRIFNIIRILLENGYKILFLYSIKSPQDQYYKEQLNGNVEFVYVPLNIDQYYGVIANENVDTIWATNLWSIESFEFMLELMQKLKVDQAYRILVDTVDYHYKKYFRKFEQENDDSDLKTAYRFKELERKLYLLADEVVVVSDKERSDILKDIKGIKKISVIPNLHQISNHSKPYDVRNHLCYVGNFEVDHNIKAVSHFIKQIFPKILSQNPNVEFHVIGNYSENYRSQFESSHVKVIGYVDELETLLSNYKLFVCPMLFGAGLKGKIGLAASAGLPIVTTPVGAEGFNLIDGSQCFIAEDPTEFAEKCNHLLSDPVAWHNFSVKAKSMILENYSSSKIARSLVEIFNSNNNYQNGRLKNAQKPSWQKLEMLTSRLNEIGWKSRFESYAKYFETSERLNPINAPAISIIVISWRYHPDTLRSFKILHKQRNHNYELIFVNNGAETAEFESLKPFINTYVRLNQNTGAYLARNIGATFSQAPTILFLEDDGIPEDNFVQSHIEAFQKYDVIAVRGVYLPKTKENQLNKLAKHYFLGDKPFPRHSDLEGNSSYDAKIFFQVGGWDDQIFFGGGGTDLSIRLLKVEPDMRKQIYYPPAVLYHDYAQNESHLLDKRKKQIRSWQRLTRKHPEINSFEKMWDKYFQREDLIVLRNFNDKPANQHAQQLQNARYPRHIMFIMYGWNDDGGGTIRPRLLAKELVKRGHTVSVIYAASRRNSLKPDYFVEESNDAGVHLFGVFNRPTLLYDIDNPKREINDPRMCEIVKKIVSEQNPDIIHYHNLVGFSMHVIEEVNKLNIPAVYTSRNYWPICPRLYLYRDDLSLCTGPSEDGSKCAVCIGRMDEKEGYAARFFQARRMLTNNVTRHLAISNRARDIFIENGFAEKQIYVLHQFPETLDWIWQKTGKLKRSKKLIPEPLNVGFLGYVLPQKGVHIMVKALQQFQKEQIAGHIFGDGPHNYIATLKNLDQNRIISFHGGYQPGELPKLLAMLDLVVVPSVWEETQGVVVLEALAAKIPVVGSRIGGIPDFIKDGFNGYLVEPNDASNLRDVLSRIVADPELLLNLRENIQPPRTSGAYIEDLMLHYNKAMIEHQSRNKIMANAIGILSKQDETMKQKSKCLTPTKNGMEQKYSLYHVNGREESLKQWMAPYADDFRGCENVLDIGCGPGLFLELLNERGISGVGFDYDSEMVAICQSKGLNAKVVKGNALSGYSEQFDGIHLGHIIEHMDGEAMVKLLETCVAALRPGGRILIRTPNWQNEAVRNGGFWLDYTHVRPYPLPLLEKIYNDLSLVVVKKGFEPGGWNDAYILGKKVEISAKVYLTETTQSESTREKTSAYLVRWEGSQFVNHSLALVNRELCIELARRQDIELSLIPYEPHEFGPEADPERFRLIEDRLQKPLSGLTDFHIRHQWPPNFTPPPEGHWIMIQPWEFGALPKSWVEPMRTLVDELWVPSNHVRDVYITSGITPDKVFVVPNGVNHNQFNPKAAKLKLNTDKRLKFLFVGGTIMRKGIDVLLSAYAEAFTAEDDVCLVIKDMGGESFYKGQNAWKIIEDIKRNPASPEILYLTETLNADQIAGLYTACDCLVHPYRGEGFGLPVAEAMACTLPVIVTRGGACDDFCSDETAYLIDSKVRPVQLDGHVLSAQGWLLEPDRAQLIDRLRFVYEHPGQAKEKGALAARQIRKKVDWKMSTDLIIKRLRALRSKPIRRFAGSIDREAAQASEAPQEIYQTIQQSMKDKRPEEVIAELEMLTESYPQFALAYNDLGVLYYTSGNKEKAHQFYEKAVELDSDNLVFQKNLADFYFVELGRVEDALRIYIQALEANPEDIETLLITGHICVALHKFEDAGVFYRRVLELEPGNEAAQNNLDKLDKMQPIAPEPKSLQEMYLEIQPLLNNGDPNKAIAALEEFLQSYPDFAVAHNDLGVLYYQTGNKEKTRDHYERATRLMPENINFQKNLADFYCIELGRIEDALKIYVSILKIDPQDVETLMATGMICKALKKHDDARDFFNRVLEIEPWNAETRKQIEEIERNPSGEDLSLESAEDAYHRLQQELNALMPAEAIVELEKLMELYPNFAIGHNDLGVLYYSNGNKEKALQHYQQAINLQPENMTLQKNLADFLFVEQGRVEEALKIYVNILARNPQDVETLLITGHICVALKKFDDAKEFYERVLALEPENEDASKNLQALIMSPRKSSSARPDSTDKVTASGAKIESTVLNPEKFEKQKDEPKTAVSIVIHLDGVQNRVKECLKSIQMHTAEPHELLFIDQGATKGMLKWARQLVKDNDRYHIIECGRQAGWAGSINRAIQKGSGDIIVLIHNDVVVPEGWLKAFIMCMEFESNIGVVGPMSNRAIGIQQFIHPDEFERIEFESTAKAFFEQNQYRRVAARKLSDFCLAFRSELTDKIGYFDEQFFLEETAIEDFCNRAVSGGYQNMIAADTFVYHYDRHPANKKASTNKPVSSDDQKKFKEKWNGAQNPEAKDFQSALFLERANELSHKGQIDQAVEVLLNAIGIQPKEQRFYLELAQILLAAKRFDDAKDALMEMPAIAEDQEMRKIELLGYAEEGLENFAAAQTHIERVLALNSDRAPALNLKAILAYRNDDRHSAEKYFKRAIASDPGYGEPYTNLGMLSLEAEQPQDALKYFEKAFRLTPSDMDIATNYHSLIAEIGEFSKAENLACEAAAIYPNNQKIKYMLIDFMIQQGKDEIAMAEIEDAIIKFGFDDGILGASLKLREKLGPMTIKKPSKKAPVSLCMIIKDEEKYLARCLASVKPIVDEMIVVDTGSTDRSKDIAVAFGAQIHDYEWENDFAAARNFSISKASGQWILILDGDELISPLDYAHFNKIVANKSKVPVAYSITTRNYSKLANFVGWVPNNGQYPDEEAAIGWLPSEKVRLFYGKDQVRFEGAVHELVDPFLERNGIKIKKCSIPVHHYGRLDKEKLDRKGTIYFDIGQEKLSEMGEDINALRELAIQATILEKNQQALELWKRLLALDPHPKMAAHAYVNMGTIYNRLGKFDDALDASKKAVANDSELKEARYNLALAELHCGNAQNAIGILEDLLGVFPDYPPAQFILSSAYCCVGQKEEGFDGIRKLKSTPLGAHLESPCSELAQSLLEANNLEYAFCVLGAAIECDIVNKEILELVTNCIQMKDKSQKLSAIPRIGLTDRQPIKFENLPQ